MQVTETLNDGLKRELKIVVPADELEGRLGTYLLEMKTKVRLKGFRPGRVPVAHLRKVYGKSAMAEIVNTVIGETTKQAMAERKEAAVTQPKVDLSDAEAEKVLAGGADLAFAAKYEVMPQFDLVPLDGIKIERPVADVDPADVEKEINRLADQNRGFVDRDEGAVAENGDRLTIRFWGTIEDKPFEGGSGDDAHVVLGSGGFIPGFEDQLLGVRADEEREVTCTFPPAYQAVALRGKTAVFKVTVKSVASPLPFSVDDSFASSIGVESLARLRELLSDQIRLQYSVHTRQRVKRQLLDQLDAQYSFPLPPSLVDAEFEVIWREVLADLERSGKTFADENTTEEDARVEYRQIAERRVRLGLVLARFGEQGKIEVSDNEVQTAIRERVRQFPGQEKEVLDFYRNNPGAVAGVRAPIFEEKTVDLLLMKVPVTDVTISKEALVAEDDDDIVAKTATAVGSVAEEAGAGPAGEPIAEEK